MSPNRFIQSAPAASSATLSTIPSRHSSPGTAHLCSFAAAVIIGTFILIKYTPLGRRIFAVGTATTHAAALSGISEKWIKIFAFTLTGFLVGVATLITSIAVFDNTGEVSELLIVTCVVVGGVSISGGSGTVVGVMLGVILLLMQKTVLINLKLADNASNWDKAIQGALILGAVLVDHLVEVVT